MEGWRRQASDGLMWERYAFFAVAALAMGGYAITAIWFAWKQRQMDQMRAALDECHRFP